MSRTIKCDKVKKPTYRQLQAMYDETLDRAIGAESALRASTVQLDGLKSQLEMRTEIINERNIEIERLQSSNLLLRGRLSSIFMSFGYDVYDEDGRKVYVKPFAFVDNVPFWVRPFIKRIVDADKVILDQWDKDAHTKMLIDKHCTSKKSRTYAIDVDLASGDYCAPEVIKVAARKFIDGSK